MIHCTFWNTCICARVVCKLQSYWFYNYSHFVIYSQICIQYTNLCLIYKSAFHTKYKSALDIHYIKSNFETIFTNPFIPAPFHPPLLSMLSNATCSSVLFSTFQAVILSNKIILITWVSYEALHLSSINRHYYIIPLPLLQSFATISFHIHLGWMYFRQLKVVLKNHSEKSFWDRCKAIPQKIGLKGSYWLCDNTDGKERRWHHLTTRRIRVEMMVLLEVIIMDLLSVGL